MQPTAPAAVDEPWRQGKAALRTAVLAARDAIPADERAKDSLAIARGIAGLASWRSATTVLLHLPFRSEWDSWALVEAARGAGKRIALPRVETAGRALVLHRVDDPRAEVGPGYQGIPEPRSDLPRLDPGQIDWILVPGVAFDGTGGRLGYGAGYYDRLLAAVDPAVHRVAGAFDAQVVGQVPREPHDIGVDLVVTPTRRIGAGCGGPS